jgi:hypothetical protein
MELNICCGISHAVFETVKIQCKFPYPSRHVAN